MGTYSRKLAALQTASQRLEAKKSIYLQKAMTSDNPSDLIKANQMIQGIQARESGHRKSFLIDPMQFTGFMGYKDKPYSLSYNLLRRMARGSMVVNAIVKTRQDQVASFCEPQTDKYSTGFVIRKKKKMFSKEDEKMSIEDEKKIELLTEFVLNCGRNNSWTADDFDTFVRKIVWDSLVYDQMNFEVTTDRRGLPYEFFATDAATIRMADTFDDEEYQNKEKIQKFGYYPSYVQVLNGEVKAEYYPWELCFGIRNPSSNIYLNGYGMSELEDLINTITSMLWAEEYNRKFFSQGSAPKGLLRVKNGGITSTTLQEFKQSWLAMVTGVTNAWRTPILEGDVEWIDLQKNNTDMQFDKYQEFLIKTSCAVYRIDPAEINFPLSGGSEQKALFEGNNEARLKHSKDKGLYPLLKMIQRRINKYLISRIDPQFEFVFTGMEGVDYTSELEADIKTMSNFMTIDQVRLKRGLEPLGPDKGGDVIANSIWLQYMNQQAMAQQGGGNPMQDDGQESGEFDEEGDEDFDFNDDGQEDAPELNQQGSGGGKEKKGIQDEGQDTAEDPFQKALQTYLNKL